MDVPATIKIRFCTLKKILSFYQNTIINSALEKEIIMTQQISLVVHIEVQKGQREKQINIYRKLAPIVLTESENK